MNIYHNPADWVSETKHETCDFHQRNPGASYAGCMCSGSYSMRLKTFEEKAAERENALGRGNLRRLERVGGPPCVHPEHNPPMHISLEAGVYEWTCPGCGGKTRFNVGLVY